MNSGSRSLFFVFSLLAGCSAENSLIDGSCREGFNEEDGNCVRSPASAPPPAEGSPSGESPSPGASKSFSSPSSSLPDAGAPAPPQGGAGGTEEADGGATILPAPDASADPDSGADHDAGSDPDAGADHDASVGSADAGLVCDAPLFACHDACVTGDSDAMNCGACGKICPSNICVAGECQGATTGDVILLGHGYADSWSTSSQVKTLVNAVGIPTTDPIRVLAYDGLSTHAAKDRSLVSAAMKGRKLAFSTLTGDDSSAVGLDAADLARHYDVVLLHGAPADAAASGAKWATALDTFTRKGGVVVALDDGASDMPGLLRSAGILPVDGHVALSWDAQIVVSSPGDVVGVQVISPYAPSDAAVGFLGITASNDVSIVSRERNQAGDGAPVVIHRVVR